MGLVSGDCFKVNVDECLVVLAAHGLEHLPSDYQDIGGLSFLITID